MEKTIYHYRWVKAPPQALPRRSPEPVEGAKTGFPRPHFILLGFLRGIGAGLVVVAFASLITLFGPLVKQEVNYRLGLTPQITPPPVSGFGELVNTAKAERQARTAQEAASYGVSTDFSLVIPKIQAASPVIPNVSVADESAYLAALKQGVAHAAGTQFPGQKGATYLFAHSTNSPLNVARYNAVFYLLKELEKGDRIIIFFTGQKYEYKVSDSIITEASDTSWLNPSPPDQEILVLQTCWPPGTTWKRLLVVAQPTGS